MIVLACITIVGLLALLAYQQKVHKDERAQLLDRIQAPERVVQQRAISHNGPVPEADVDHGPFGPPPMNEDD